MSEDSFYPDTGAVPVWLGSAAAPRADGLVDVATPSAGVEIAPGAAITLSATFAPISNRPLATRWSLGLLGYASSASVPVVGRGIGMVKTIAPLTSSSWQRTGAAVMQSGGLRLTGDQPRVAGAAYLSTPVATSSMVIHATVTISPGKHCCGDGMAVVLASPNRIPTAGGAGWGDGFAGTYGFAIVLGEFPDPGAPSPNDIGLASGQTARHDGLHWVATAPIPSAVGHGPTSLTIIISGTRLTVRLDGTTVLTSAFVNTGRALIGVTAGTGLKTAIHDVRDLTVAVPA
jgi:hypothetical protein